MNFLFRIILVVGMSVMCLGDDIKPACLGCSINARQVSCPGGTIAATEFFTAHQDYAVPIPGFIIIASLRHVQSIDALTHEEGIDLITFLRSMRIAMREALGIETVYVIQEEDASHLHIWLLPLYDWMKEQFGHKIQSVKPVMDYAKKTMRTPFQMIAVKDAADLLRQYFQDHCRA